MEVGSVHHSKLRERGLSPLEHVKPVMVKERTKNAVSVSDPSKQSLEVGSVYRLDHSKLPESVLSRLRHVKAVMVKERTKKMVSVSYPSKESLEVIYGREENGDKRTSSGLMQPNLDLVYTMTVNLAETVLCDPISFEEFASRRGTRSFLINGGSEMKIRWGVRKRVTFVRKHKKNNEKPLLLEGADMKVEDGDEELTEAEIGERKAVMRKKKHPSKYVCTKKKKKRRWPGEVAMNGNGNEFKLHHSKLPKIRWGVRKRVTLTFVRKHRKNKEYWLESADLVSIRKQAGVDDPYLIPSEGWTLGDSPTQDPVCAKELKKLREDVDEIESEIQERSNTKSVEGKALVSVPEPLGDDESRMKFYLMPLKETQEERKAGVDEGWKLGDSPTVCAKELKKLRGKAEIEEQLLNAVKAINHTEEFSFPDIKGTLIGIMKYTEGIAAFMDSRGTVVLEGEEGEEGEMKIYTIFAKQFAEELKETIEKSNSVSYIDIAANISYSILEGIAKSDKFKNTKENSFGDILLGWRSDKKYEAYSIDCTEEESECTKISGLSYYVQGSGAPSAESRLDKFWRHSDWRQIQREECLRRIKITMLYAYLHTASCGGETKVFMLRHGSSLNGQPDFKIDPIDLHSNNLSVMTKNHVILMIVPKAYGGHVERTCDTWNGVMCTSYMIDISKKDSVYRIMCRTTQDLHGILRRHPLTNKGKLPKEYFQQYLIRFGHTRRPVPVYFGRCDDRVLNFIKEYRRRQLQML